MSKFNEVLDNNYERLEQYVPVVSRVHGGSHPEFYDVEKVYNVISSKLLNDNLDLESEFVELRKITNNYTVPSDVCETYEAVYVMLSELDKAY